MTDKPIAITIKTTDACNMRCKHCYHAEVGFHKNSLNLSNAKKILELAVKEYNKIDILFMGGEPTLWGIDNFKDFLLYENYLTEKYSIKFRNTIQTNGLLLNDDFIRLFIKYNFNVGISFDGPHNDDLREFSDIVLNNIFKSKNMGLNINLLCVENGFSIHNLLNTYNWFKKQGLDFKILPIFMSGNALDNTNFELNSDEYVLNLMDVYKYWIKDQDCNIKVSTFQNLLRILENVDCIHRGNSCICNRIAIVAGGNIYPCGRPYPDEFKVGHIDKFDSISQMFNSKAYLYLKKINNERIENCRSCEVFNACKGGCISNAILENSYSEIGNPYCVKTKKMLLELKKINKEIYSLYDENKLTNINPKALNIIKKIRDK